MTDLSFAALFATPAGYRVTGTFDGTDLLNGGMHRATDVGNRGMDDPILSPVDGYATGRRHFDGALGITYELPGGWSLELWHLNATLAPVGAVQKVTHRQVCGRTGNTGARVNNMPMPAHTHIVLLDPNRVPHDVQPYLEGKPFDPLNEEPLMIPTEKVNGLFGKVLTTHQGANVREAASTSSRLIHSFPAGSKVIATGVVTGQFVNNDRPGNQWYTVWIEEHLNTLTGFLHDSAAYVDPADVMYEIREAAAKAYDKALSDVIAAVERL